MREHDVIAGAAGVSDLEELSAQIQVSVLRQADEGAKHRVAAVVVDVVADPVDKEQVIPVLGRPGGNPICGRAPVIAGGALPIASGAPGVRSCQRESDRSD